MPASYAAPPSSTALTCCSGAYSWPLMLLSWPPSLTWPRTLNPKPVTLFVMVTSRGPAGTFDDMVHQQRRQRRQRQRHSITTSANDERPDERLLRKIRLDTVNERNARIIVVVVVVVISFSLFCPLARSPSLSDYDDRPRRAHASATETSGRSYWIRTVPPCRTHRASCIAAAVVKCARFRRARRFTLVRLPLSYRSVTVRGISIPFDRH